MYCSNCGKGNPKESQYCRYCGCEIKFDNNNDKNKQEEKRVTKISFKKAIILIIVGILLVFGLIFLGVVLVNSNQENSDKKIINEQSNNDNIIKTYELNKVDFFKGTDKIQDEKYDEKNNLIYYKTNDSEITFDYEYDKYENIISITHKSKMFYNEKNYTNKININ